MVNSNQNPKELVTRNDINIATADATRVCQKLGLVIAGLTVVNTAMMGAFIRAIEVVDMANIRRIIRERFPSKVAEINLAAIEETYDITKLEKIL